jgi:hypothetical protein
MWISSGSNPLPVEYDARDAHLRLSEHFMDWGKPVRVSAPTKVYGQRLLRS